MTLWPPLRNAADRDAIEREPLEHWRIPATSLEALEAAAAAHPDRAALLHHVVPSAPTGRAVTYARLLARVRRWANLLRSLGVGRGDAVTILTAPGTGTIGVTLAAQMAGIAAPISPSLRSVRVTELMRLSGSSVLVADGPEIDARRWAKALRYALATRMTTVLALRPEQAEGPGPPLPSAEGMTLAYLQDIAVGHRDDALDFTDVPGPDDLCSFFLTGGTTGAPKLAAHIQRTQMFMAWTGALIAELAPGECTLAGLPMYHVEGLVTGVLAPLMRGATIVWPGGRGFRDVDVYPDLWRLIARLEIRAMAAVPAVYAALAAVPPTVDVACLRVPAVGAAPLPNAVRRAFRSATRGTELLEGYGLTEVTCVSISQLAEERTSNSIGIRLPYQDVRIVARRRIGRNRELPVGAVGEIAIGGPAVFAGYVRRAEGRRVIETRGDVRDGMLLTADLASVDTAGRFVFHGREKDRINRGGHDVDPRLIEDSMRRHPRVRAASAVGRPDRGAGEVPVVYVVAPGTHGDELCAWAAENVPDRLAAPAAVYLVDVLPHSDFAKPTKLPLREDAARRALSADLAAAGFAVDPADIVVKHVGPRLVATIPAFENVEDTHRLRRVVAPYALDVLIL